MRFFIGAVVSTLILSPISVLSMALDTPAMSSMAQVKVQDGTIQQQYPVASTPLGSSLQKRFCIRKCSEEHKLGYLCRRKFISDYRIKKAKNAACPKIKANLQKSSFPSLHTALKFDSPGPYIEWPVKRNGRFWNNWRKGKYRIVLTEDCNVVGAAIRNKDGSYIKCSRLGDKEDDD